jgi:hypothetical protein
MKIYGLLIASAIMMHIGVSAQTSQALFKELKKESVKEKLRFSSKEELLRLAKMPLYVEQESADKKTRGFSFGDKKLSSISSAAVSEGEGYITIDRGNTNRLAVGFMDNNSARNPPILYRVYTSNDGGTTFASSTINTGTIVSNEFPGYFVGGGGDPVLEYDKDGVLHFSWIYLLVKVNVGTGSIDSIRAAMFHATSTNNGNSFTLNATNKFIAMSEFDPVEFNNTGDLVELPGSPGFHDRQWFALDRTTGPHSNALYCSFVYFPTASDPAGTGGGSIRKLTNSTGAWGPKVQALTGAIQFNNVRVDNQGVLHITGADVNSNEVIYSKSTDGGASFSSPIVVAPGTNLFGDQGNGYIHDRENSATNMEVDGANNVHVVWSDFNFPTDSNFNAFYARKLSSASSFNTLLDLRTIFNTNLRALMPTISTSNNNVTIGAYFIEPATKRSRYRIVNSKDNGVTWDSPLTVSTDSFLFNSASNTGKWFGDYFNAVRTDSKMYNIWSDGRGTSGTKMYISVVSEWATGVQEYSPVDDALNISGVIPNPAQTNFSINIVSTKNTIINAVITSINGAVITTKKQNIIEGAQTLNFDVSTLAAGVYAVNITTEDGVKYCRKLVK